MFFLFSWPHLSHSPPKSSLVFLYPFFSPFWPPLPVLDFYKNSNKVRICIEHWWNTTFLLALARARTRGFCCQKSGNNNRGNGTTWRMKVLFYPMLSDLQNSISFWKVPKLRSFVLPIRATCRRRRAQDIDRVILTAKTRSTQNKTCLDATLFTTNLELTELESKLNLAVTGR